MLQVLFIVAFAGICLAGHGGFDGSVDTAIENVDLVYSDKLCLELLMVDCSQHVTVHEEQICGTDGVTYPTHCNYVHAYCEFAYSKEHLHVANHGPCAAVVSTTAAPTTATPIVTGTGGVTNAPQTVATGLPSGSTAPPSASTAPPSATVGSSTPSPVSTTTGPATTNANHGLIEGVFCASVDTISCASSGVDVICASNDVLYPNQCEFAKARCKIPTLKAVDASQCTGMGK